MYNLWLLTIIILFLYSCSIAKITKYYVNSDSSRGKLNGSVYNSKDTVYEIGILPDTWERIGIKGGDLAFWNEGFDSTITVNSTCDKNQIKYNLNALSSSLVIGIGGKEIIKNDEVNVNGENALQRVYTGILSGSPIKLSTVVFKKGSCIYDFSYSSPPDNFEKGFDEFNNFISQFKVISGSI